MAGDGGTSGSGGAGATSAGGDPGCRTSITGTVYDPSGEVPLPNVVVYVPSAPPAAMRNGSSCDACQNFISPRPVAAGFSDTIGEFTLVGVPPGDNVPLVIEIGKWRRQAVIPSVPACATTALTDHELTRLPRRQSEGHMPHIALATGHGSALECLLRKIGIADDEFTNDAGNGSVHLYAGGAGNAVNQGTLQTMDGQIFSDAYASLFADPARLAGYDFVVLGCEGSSLVTEKAPYRVNLRRYADHGGRLFLEHLGSSWISQGLPPWPSTAAWSNSVLVDLPSSLLATVSTSFPKGLMLTSWLNTLGASTSEQVTIVQAEHSVDEPVAAGVQAWLTTAPTPPAMVEPILHLSFGTPIEVDPALRCGRVDFSGMHVASTLGASSPALPFPSECTSSEAVSPQQRMWEFWFFDTAACVFPDGH